MTIHRELGPQQIQSPMPDFHSPHRLWNQEWEPHQTSHCVLREPSRDSVPRCFEYPRGYRIIHCSREEVESRPGRLLGTQRCLDSNGLFVRAPLTNKVRPVADDHRFDTQLTK